MEINKESFKYFLEKIAKLLGTIFPGILIFEIYFKIGLFSKIPSDLFSILLYIIWVIILSIPFHYFNPNSIDTYMKSLLKAYSKHHQIPLEEMKEAYENIDENQEEELKNIESEFVFGFVILKVCSFYLIYKFVKYYGILYFSFIDIPYKYINLLIVLFFTYLISFPIAFIYSKISIYQFEKYLKNDIL